jgi:hypothetical protein
MHLKPLKKRLDCDLFHPLDGAPSSLCHSDTPCLVLPCKSMALVPKCRPTPDHPTLSVQVELERSLISQTGFGEKPHATFLELLHPTQPLSQTICSHITSPGKTPDATIPGQARG